MSEVRRLTEEQYKKLQEEKKVRKLTDEEFSACLTYQVVNADWKEIWKEYIRMVGPEIEAIKKALYMSYVRMRRKHYHI